MDETADFASLRIDVRDGIATVLVSRPQALNALSSAVLGELRAAFSALGDQGSALRGVLLAGEGGRAFVAGADIRELTGLTPEEGAALSRLGHEVAGLIEGLQAPVIACVDGFALGGGCELALACDLIYATEASTFGQPEVKLGLVPGFGGTVRLPRAVGLARAKEIIYSGRTIDAAEAERIGLVSRLFGSREDLLAGAHATLAEIAGNAAPAVAIAKAILVEATGRPTDAASKREVDGFRAAFETADMREGTAAFLEKRAPRFTGA